METLERDYTPKGVQFYYLYKQLAHPELSNYVDPFTLDERLMHVKQAEAQLGSRIPWITDAMTNELKHALGDMPNAEFIVDPEGRVVERRAWSNPAALRRDLERLIGPVETPTQVSDLDLATQPPIPTVAKGIVPRVELPGRMSTLRIEPKLDEADLPFYAKLRADVSQDFLRTGRGKLYIGFHLDPLYRVHWNNEAPPLEYNVTAPAGVRITPATGVFPDIEEPADADPREFLLDIVAEDRSAPFDLSVSYYGCDDAITFCILVTQDYTVHLEVDGDAGRVFGTGRRFGRGRLGGNAGGNAGGNGLGAARGAGGRAGPGGIVDRMLAWDANDDGVITRDEAPNQMKERFDRIDENADGMLEEVELRNALAMLGSGRRGGGPGLGTPQGRGAGRGADPVGRLRQFDADADGQVSRDEVPDGMAPLFDRFDANHDDVIDDDEIAAMVERLRQGVGSGR